MIEAKLRFRVAIFLVLAGGVCLGSVPSPGGISQPSLVIYGGVYTPAAKEITVGQLLFEFIPVEGDDTVSVGIGLDQVKEGVSFLARVPIETSPVSKPDGVLTLGGDYSVKAYYNGSEVSGEGLQSLLAPASGQVIGPLGLTFSGDTPLLDVSEDIDFGVVMMDSFVERSFQVSNAGKSLLKGTVQLVEGVHFFLTEGGVGVSEWPIDLEGGESIGVTVRCSPTATGQHLDRVAISTNAGSVERTVRGNCITQLTTFDLHSPGSPDGKIDARDLLELIKLGEVIPLGQTLLDFSSQWQDASDSR